MVNDDIVKCPLCSGFTHIEKPELREALKNPRLREQIEHYIAELLKSPVEELTNVGATQAGATSRKMCIPGILACPCGGEARRSRDSRFRGPRRRKRRRSKLCHCD